MAKKFPEIKEENEGKFTKWVEKNMGGMDTCKAASKIMRSKTKKYSSSVIKMANYANNLGCKTKKEGASFNPEKGKIKQAVENFKTRNELTSYTKGDPNKPTVVITTKKKARKIEKKANKAEEKASNPKSTNTKSSKAKSVKYKKPKNAKYGIQKGKVNKQRLRKK